MPEGLLHEAWLEVAEDVRFADGPDKAEPARQGGTHAHINHTGFPVWIDKFLPLADDDVYP